MLSKAEKDRREPGSLTLWNPSGPSTSRLLSHEKEINFKEALSFWIFCPMEWKLIITNTVFQIKLGRSEWKPLLHTDCTKTELGRGHDRWRLKLHLDGNADEEVMDAFGDLKLDLRDENVAWRGHRFWGERLV